MAVDYPYWDMEDSYVRPLKEAVMILKPQNILEIGFGQWGFSTRVWLEYSNAHVTSVDKGDWMGAAAEYTKNYPQRFTFITGLSEEVLPTLKPDYDFIYIDGDHSYEGCKSDILLCQKLLKPKGVILLDDYGVENVSAVNLDENGNPIDGHFGVKQATDEYFNKWQPVLTDINFANGGRAYAQTGRR